MIKKRLTVLLTLTSFLMLAGGCASGQETSLEESGSTQETETAAGENQEAEESFFAMDTYMTFSAYGEGAQDALSDARDRVEQLETEWSVTDENSEIYKINHSGGETVTLSEDTAEILKFALEMAEKTDGALEPTIYPVLRAWGFTTDENRIPGEAEIQSLLENTGYEKITLNGNEVQIPEGMELDLGAVGKGYAGDEAAEVLKEQGISCALLNLGGNVQAIGSRPDGTGWRLGIQNPFGEGYVGILSISDRAVVTSGNYERYFVGEDGKTYGHIIDPSTGYPADNSLASVSIIAEEGKIGDALSTSLFVMGQEKAEQFWRENPVFDMILVTEDGEVYVTEGIQEQFALESPFADEQLHVLEEE